VFALGVGPGPVTLMPALTILPDATIAEFDQRFPEGADYVIVPAMRGRCGGPRLDQTTGRR